MRRAGWLFAALLAGCPPEISLPDGDGGGAAMSTGGAAGSAMGGGGALDCAELDDACNTFELEGSACVATPRPDGLPCYDGLGCTLLDHCEAGACVPGAPAACASPDACLVAHCDELTDQCELVPGNDGAACEDGDLCTTGTTCSAALCGGGAAVDCGEANECSEPRCDPSSGCYVAPINAGLPCGGQPPPCQGYHCVPELGGYCAWYAIDEGQPCADPFECTLDDVCFQGECVGSYAPEGTPCPVDASCFTGGACFGIDCYPSGDTCGESTEECIDRACGVLPDACVGLAFEGDACESPSVCRSGGTCYGGTCATNWLPDNEGAPCDEAKTCMQPGACTAGECVGAPVTACVGGDGCCPAGCSEGNDSDCGVRVYMASTQSLPGFFAFDPDAGTWATLPDPPSPIRSRLTALGGVVLALGEDLALYQFDPGPGSWTLHRALPSPTSFPTFPAEGAFLANLDGSALLAPTFSSDWLLRAVGQEWTLLWVLYISASAGSWDRVSRRLLVRHGQLPWVYDLDPDTGWLTQWGWDDAQVLTPGSRFGSYVDGAFYVAVEPDASLLRLSESSQGAGELLGLTTADPNPSSDADPETGLVYIGPSGAAGAFQALDTLTDTLIDLPSPPAIPDGYLSSLAVVRAPRTP